jgi:glutathione synthase/RimK-type ligase-like ATP-grasp enzyme
MRQTTVKTSKPLGLSKTKTAKKEEPAGSYRPQIRSRHPSHDALRGALPRFPFRSVVRFGSTTEVDDSLIQINSVAAVENSASKIRMKQAFTNGRVKTAEYILGSQVRSASDLSVIRGSGKSPVVAKSNYGSRGEGNSLLRSTEEIDRFIKSHKDDLRNYVFERFYNYTREYRLHVTANGCFYTCRKLLKEDTPKDERWYRNDSNSVWIVDSNELFDRPINWHEIEQECVKALRSVGLDFGACDVKVQSPNTEDGKKRTKCDFIIIEINSAPSFGEITQEKYEKILPQLINQKFEILKNK